MAHIHGGNIEQVRQKYDLQDKEIIDFSANINLLGPPLAIKKIMDKNPGIVTHYPQPQARALKQELAKKLNLPAENIIIGNGAVEIIYQLLRILQPELSLIPAPSFSEYMYAVKSIDKEIKRIYLQDKNKFRLDIEKYISCLEDVDLAFICNPHNPTGMLLEKNDLLRIIKSARKQNVDLILDEAFIDFVDNSDQYTLIDNIREYDNLFIIRSLTKFFAIPGLRLGYGIGSEKLFKKMEMRRDPWSVNGVAQEAGKIALRDKKYIAQTKKINKKERSYFYKKLKAISNIEVFKPMANFIFIKLKSGFSASELKKIMALEGILIRDCSSYHGLDNKHMRVAVRYRKDNNRLLSVFKKVFS